MINIEICISSDNLEILGQQVLAAKNGGAKRVELCSNMQHDGLTPNEEAIELARSVLTGEQELMVMIRPREGGFYYLEQEIEQIRRSILSAAKSGANGVVLGLLDASQTALDITAMRPLVELAIEEGLAVTCHRAFDALLDPVAGLKQLKTLGVSRILTAGGKWGQPCQATNHGQAFSRYLQAAQGDIEIICAGGITSENAASIVAQQKQTNKKLTEYLSLHAHSGVLTDGLVDTNKVAGLCRAANNGE